MRKWFSIGNFRRPGNKWLVLLIALLPIVILIAGELGLISTRPDEVSAQINPLTTADYSPWDVLRFGRVDPALGTQVAEINIATNIARTAAATGLPFQVALQQTDTPIPTAGPSSTPTNTPTPTITDTPSNTPTGTLTASSTPTNTPTTTLTNTPTNTPTITQTATNTPTSTVTSTATNTQTATNTPTNTPTATNTPTPAPPVAAFSYTQLTTASAPFTVQFNNLSTGTITSYLWTFGDGSPSSTQANPTHDYAATGFYAVTLTVTGPGGSDFATQNVNVTQTFTAPVANFSATQVAGQPLQIAFTNTTTGVVTNYLWDFDNNGTTDSTFASPTFTYTTPGLKTIRLTAVGPGGTNSITLSINVVQSSFTRAPASGGAPLVVTLTNTSAPAASIFSYLWNFGDGNTSPAQNPGTHTYATSGTYTITLTVNSAIGSNSSSQTVNVIAAPVANFTVTQNPATPFTIGIANGSSGTINNYIWDLGDGTTGSGPTPPSAHTYAGAGPWTVTITAENTALGLSDVWTNTFTLIAPPVANFTVAQVGSPPNTIAVTNVSTGNITGYSWTFGDGVGTSTQQNPPNYTYAAGATYTVTLTVNGPGGSDTTTRTINVIGPPNASFTVVQDPATPYTVAVTNNSTGSITTYLWDYGDSVGTSTAANPPNYSYAGGGTYTISLTVNGPGGPDTFTQMITLIDPPVANFAANPTSGFAPLTVMFTNASTGTITGYSWDFGDTTTSTAANPPNHVYNSANTYNVILTVNGPGGSDAFTVPITVNGLPDLRTTMTVNNATPREGQNITYRISVRNDGAFQATGVTVNFPIPATLTYVSHSVGDIYDPVGGVWTIGTLNAAQTVIIDVIVNVGMQAAFGPGNEITANANAMLTEPDAIPGNNATSIQISVVETDLNIDKFVDDTTPDPCQIIQYTVTATNLGGRNATGVVVNDPQQPNVNYQSHTATNGAGSYIPGTGVWTIGALANGATEQLIITLQVDCAFASGVVSSTATISGNEYDPITANNSNPSTIFVQSTDLRVTKTVSDTTPLQGQTITYTIMARNAGPLNDTGVVVNDSLPAGVTYVSDTGGGAYNPGSGVWNIGNMTNGQLTTLFITVTVNNVAGPGFITVTNTATISGTLGDYSMGNNTANQSFTVETSDISVTKSVSNPSPAPGENIVYTINVTNNGPRNATNVSATDTLPANVTYVSDNSGGAYNPGSGVWTIGNLANTVTATLNITVQVNPAIAPGTSVVNNVTASATEYDPNAANNAGSATFTIPAVDLSVAKSVNNGTPNRNDTIIYTIAVTNNSGTTGATGVSVSDTLPANVTYVSNNVGAPAPVGGVWTWNIGSLAAGASTTANITVTVNPAAPTGVPIGNTANVSGNEFDPAGGNNSSTANFTIPSVDLSVAKSVNNATPNRNDTIIYTVIVTNNSGTFGATGVSVSDTLPANVTYVSNDVGAGAPVGGVWTWNIGALAAGASATANITVTVNPAAPTGVAIANTASVSGSQVDPAGGNNSSTANFTIPSVDLSIAKSVNNATPNRNDTIIYTVIVTNNSGTFGATGVSVSDTLPANVTYVSNDVGAGAPVGGVWTWNIGSLAAGASTTANITVTVNPAAPTGVAIANTANVSGSQVDPAGGNNSSTANFTIPSLDLSISKTVDNPAPNRTDPIIYTLSVTNNSGTFGATGVTVNDTLPADVTYTGDDSGGAYNSGSGVWTIGSLAPSATVTLNIFAQVSAAAPPSTPIVNNASIATVNQVDSNPANDASSASFTVPSIDLSISKTVNNASPAATQAVIFTFTVTNTGGNNATSVTVSDTLPANVTYVSNDVGAPAPVGGVWTWNVGALAGGVSATGHVTVTINAVPSGTVINNTGTVALGAPQVDGNGANNSSTATMTVAPSADLASIIVSVDDNTPAPGQTVTFTFNLTNFGPNTATGITLQVTDGGSYDTTFNPPNVNSGATWVSNPTYTVPAGTSGTTITITRAIIAMNEFDPNTGNNIDTIDLMIP